MRSILRKLRSAAPNLALAALVAFVVTPARADGAWVLETIDHAGSSPNDCAFTKLALDLQGVPRVVYSWGVQPRIATRGAGGWTYESLVASEPQAAPASASPLHPDLLNMCFPAIAIDPLSGEPRVGFLKMLSGNNWYASRSSGGTWAYDLVVPNTGSPSLAIDAQGNAHEMIGSQYWWQSGGTWNNEIVDPAGGTSALRLDHQGRPRAALLTGYPVATLNYASRQTGIWGIEGVADSVTAYALALDGADEPCLAYFDTGRQSLRYAHHENGAWVIEDVASVNAAYVSLALGGGGSPFIAYTDPYGGNHLCFARRSAGPGSAWITETVDGSYECGLYCSLAIDAAGRPHIAYFESPTRRARYAMLPGAVTFAAPPRPEARFRLARAFPNPLGTSGRVLLDLRLPAPRKVSLELLDAAGRVVARLAPVPMAAGDVILPWSPAVRASGLFFLRATTDRGETAVTRLALTR